MRFGIALLCGIAACCAACSKPDVRLDPEKTKSTDELYGRTAAPPAPKPPPAPTSFSEVVTRIGGDFSDFKEEFPEPALLLAQWSAVHDVKIDEILGFPSTSIASAMKNSSSARAQRICASGRILQVAAETVAGSEISQGLIADNGANYVRFIAFGSSGDLVKNSPAKFCGLVIGRSYFQNLGGGTTESLGLIGMFDLPSNRAPKPPLKSGAGPIVVESKFERAPKAQR